MARVHNQRARKPHICGICGDTIPVGKFYHWFQLFKAPKQYRCHKHFPKPSELTGSDKLSQLYGAQESAQDSINSGWDSSGDIIATLEDMKVEAEDVMSQYGESMEAMPEQFQGNSSSYELMEEAVSSISEWIDEIDEAISVIEGFGDVPVEEEENIDGDDAIDTWRESIEDEALNAITALGI